MNESYLVGLAFEDISLMKQQERQKTERGAIKYAFVLYFGTIREFTQPKHLHGAFEEHIQKRPTVQLEKFGPIGERQFHQPGVDRFVRL